MNSGIEVLAIIPARGGSKSIPGKNIREFAGHPLIAFSIVAALQAEKVTRTIVSTDDQEIAAISRQYGAETPFLRPVEISMDNTLDLPVFRHALNWLAEQENYHPDVVVQLRPTSPVRPRGCVDDAIAILLNHPDADSVRGVVIASQNPYKMWQINDQGRLVPLVTIEGVKDTYNVPRQDLPSVYWQTGHIDAIRPATILQKSSMSGEFIYPLIIDPRYTVDIDTLLDWQQAERLVDYTDLDMVYPGSPKRRLPDHAELLVLDFDGVFTDDRVWVDETGREMIAANRGDGLGLRLLRELTALKIVVLSREVNPVVAARCEKLFLPYIQGVKDKAAVLAEYLKKENIDPKRVIYMGNDIIDLPCFPMVACAVAPANSHLKVRRNADLVLERGGGEGAVRELCDLLIEHYPRQQGEVDQ